ncbi:hypothetical protein [Paraburkholderia saeva]|uniref:Uncharacterized protein n=1 Tax=Paraburkholderia saeva TaxID=2777537 RepID=A0A9N8X3C5_9BURK|nr:hypothetical protein [Paraburkholderia saeva]CAG4919343.1 hypothetical protein LMG31841_04868 [Paraburkholderia saeva]
MSWNHQDWLSFAQAVASTAAVIGAFGVVFLQHRLERRRAAEKERTEARRVLNIATAFVGRAYRVVADISDARNDVARVERDADRKKHRSDLTEAMDALVSLPIHTIPTFKAAQQLIRARSELAAACHEASRDRGIDGPGNQEYGAPWTKWEARLAEAAKKIRDEANAFQE